MDFTPQRFLTYQSFLTCTGVTRSGQGPYLGLCQKYFECYFPPTTWPRENPGRGDRGSSVPCVAQSTSRGGNSSTLYRDIRRPAARRVDPLIQGHVRRGIRNPGFFLGSPLEPVMEEVEQDTLERVIDCSVITVERSCLRSGKHLSRVTTSPL